MGIIAFVLKTFVTKSNHNRAIRDKESLHLL